MPATNALNGWDILAVGLCWLAWTVTVRLLAGRKR
jgi:hypothetical protein